MRSIHPAKCLFVLASAALAFSQQPPSDKPELRPVPGTPAATVPADAVVLTVGTEKITRAQFEDLLAALAESGRPAATATARRQVAEQFGDLKGLAQEARKRKLDQSPSVKQMIGIQTDQVLAGSLAKELSDAKPDDAAAHAFYDSHKGEYEQATASHILIRFKGSQVPLKPNQKDLTEPEALAKAQEIRKKLADGADFAATAKAESDDAGSGANGGSLGTFPHGQMVPQFEQAVFTMPVGQISEPVKTQFGYHIIKVVARTSKSFDEAKADIGKQMGKDAMEGIRKQTQVTLDEKYFGSER
jgi:peptidyl-prolyl cis-trans isomerase C